MDLVGPLPAAQGNCRFAAVAVDYFTKWAETKPHANIKPPTIQKFFWQNIVCRFGVPRELAVDNEKQFSSVNHPQSNGAVETANDLIFSGIQKCLFDKKRQVDG
jgi:hypothetical protein